MVRSDTVGSDVTPRSPRDGVRNLDCELQSGKTRSFLSRDTRRCCNKRRDEKHDECINEWSQTAAWPQQGGGSSGDAARPVNMPKGPAQALALAGSS